MKIDFFIFKNSRYLVRSPLKTFALNIEDFRSGGGTKKNLNIHGSWKYFLKCPRVSIKMSFKIVFKKSIEIFSQISWNVFLKNHKFSALTEFDEFGQIMHKQFQIIVDIILGLKNQLFFISKSLKIFENFVLKNPYNIFKNQQFLKIHNEVLENCTMNIRLLF